MAVALGVFSSHPSLLACQLARLSDQVVLRPPVPITTAGLGSYAADDVLYARYAAGQTPASLRDSAFRGVSDALLYRAQNLAPNVSVDVAGQPLGYRRWFFAESATLEAVAPVQAGIERELPTHLRRHVGTSSLAAAAFALFLAKLRGFGRTDESELEAPIAARMLGEVARTIARRSAEAGAPHAARVKLAATNGRMLLAARVGGDPLFYRLLEGSARCELCTLPGESSGREATLRAHEQSRAVAVSDRIQPGAPWLELGDGQVLCAGPAVRPTVLAV